jgi:hypothetical protein
MNTGVFLSNLSHTRTRTRRPNQNSWKYLLLVGVVLMTFDDFQQSVLVTRELSIHHEIYGENVEIEINYPFHSAQRTAATHEEKDIMVLDRHYDLFNFKNPNFISGSNDISIRLPDPKVGQHRPDVDVVFCFARGYNEQVLARFVGSLIATGFQGDIVLGVLPWDGRPSHRQVQEYLEYHAIHHHVIAYEIALECVPPKNKLCQATNLFQNSTSHTFVSDFRAPRDLSQLRYEYYWAWTQLYSSGSRILVSDGRDVFFQQNPFEFLPTSMARTLYAAVEDPNITIESETHNSRWIQQAAGGGKKGEGVLQLVRQKNIICSGTTLGGKIAMEAYLRAMIQLYDENPCTLKGCDQGYHQILIHTGILQQRSGRGLLLDAALTDGDPHLFSSSMLRRIESIEFQTLGSSFISTLAMFCIYHQPLRSNGLLDNTTDTVLNWDGSPVAIVHQFDRCRELNAIMDSLATNLFQQWRDSSSPTSA